MSSGIGLLNKEIFLGLQTCLLYDKWLRWWLALLFFCTKINPTYVLYIFLAPIRSQVEGGALEEGALVGELTLCRHSGFVYQGVITSSWFLTSCTFFTLHIPFDCLANWFSLVWQVEGGARVTDWSRTPSRSRSEFSFDQKESIFHHPGTHRHDLGTSPK